MACQILVKGIDIDKPILKLVGLPKFLCQMHVCSILKSNVGIAMACQIVLKNYIAQLLRNNPAAKLLCQIRLLKLL